MAKLSIMGPAASSAPASSSVPFAATNVGIASNTLKTLLGRNTVQVARPGFLPPANIVPNNENPYLKVAEDIGQGIAKRVGSVGLTVINKVLGAIQPKSVQPTIQIPSYLHPLFGADTNTISDVPTAAQAAADKIKASPLAQKLGLDKAAVPLGYGLVAAGTALDLTGIGGEKGAVEALAKETDPEIIVGILRKIGIDQPTAEKFAPDIAAAKTPQEVNEALNLAKGTHGLSILSDAEAAHAATPEGANTIDAASSEIVPAEVATPAPVYTVEKIAVPEIQTAIESDKFAPEVGDTIKAADGNTAKISDITPTATGTSDIGLVSEDGKTISTLKGVKIPELARPAAEDVGEAVAAFDKNAPIDAAVVQKFAASDDPFDTLDMVKQEYPGLPDAVAKRTATRLAGETDAMKVESILKGARNLEARMGAGEIKPGADAAAVEAEAPAARAALDITKTPEAVDNGPDVSEMPIAEKVGVEKAKTPIAKIIEGKDAKTWQALTRGFIKRLPKQKLVNFLDYLNGTPEYVLEKIGLADAAEGLQDAKYEAIDLRRDYRNKLISWKSEVDAASKGRGEAIEANKRIFRWLDGDAYKVQKDMSPTELKVAKELKAWLGELADKMHLPPESRISNYITHIFENTSATGAKETIFDDPEMMKLMQQPAKSVHNPFLEARLGKQGYIEDTWRVLDIYAKRASRKIAMDPALERLAQDAHKLNGDEYEYVEDHSHRVNLRPMKVDKLVDKLLKETPGIGNRFGDRPLAALTSKWRRMFSRGMYGLNFRSALNNLSQGANTYAKLKEKYTVLGYSKLAYRMATGNLKDLKLSGVLDEAFSSQDRRLGIKMGILQRIDPGLFGGLKLSELINRGSTFYGAMAKAGDKGLSPAESLKYARRMVRETQFSFDQVDTPVWLSGDVAKTLAQGQSYNSKQIEFLTRMVKNKEFGGLVRYSLATLAFMQTIGSIYGMTVDELFPTVGVGGNPFLRSVKDVGDLGFGNVQEKAKATSDLWQLAASLFPAGAQIRKSIQGVSAVEAGRSKSASGKTVQYVIPKTTGNAVRAGLFGKSSLPQAQAYYYKLDHPKAKGSKTKLSI